MRWRDDAYRVLIGSLCAACAVFLLNGCSKPAAAPQLTYAGQYYPEEFLLQQDPFWDGSNNVYQLFPSGTEGNEALIAGRVDANVASDTKSVALFTAIPERAVIIACVQSGDRYATVVASGNAALSWEDLKGKTVATRMGSGAEVVLRRYYAAHGLAWEDFNYVNLDVVDMIGALKTGHIDAFTAWSVTPELAEAQGVGRRLPTSYAEFAAPACIHTTTTAIEHKREQLVQLLVTHLKKAKMIKDDPHAAAAAAAREASRKGVNIPEAAFLAAFQRIDFEIRLDPQVIEAIRSTAAFMVERKMIDHAPPITSDPRLLEDARKRLETP